MGYTAKKKHKNNNENDDKKDPPPDFIVVESPASKERLVKLGYIPARVNVDDTKVVYYRDLVIDNLDAQQYSSMKAASRAVPDQMPPGPGAHPFAHLTNSCNSKCRPWARKIGPYQRINKPYLVGSDCG